MNRSLVKQKVINHLGEMYGIADIQNSAIQNGAITVTLGSNTTGEVYYSNNELWGVPNIISRPLNPTQAANTSAAPISSKNNTGCQGIYLNYNDQKIVFAARDLRQAANINPGETFIYAPAGASTIYLDQNSTVTITTSGGKGITASESSMTLSASDSVYVTSNQVLLAGATGATNELVMVNATSLVQFLTELVTAIATITTVTPGATAMAPIQPLLTTLQNMISATKTYAQ